MDNEKKGVKLCNNIVRLTETKPSKKHPIHQAKQAYMTHFKQDCGAPRTAPRRTLPSSSSTPFATPFFT